MGSDLIDDGRPASAHERELLTVLAEEAAEVVRAVTKLLRFGIGNTDPKDGVKNDYHLGLECGEFSHMLKLCTAAGLIARDALAAGEQRKEERFKIYQRYPAPKPITIPNHVWHKLPIEVRKQWWDETNYGAFPQAASDDLWRLINVALALSKA